MLHYLMSKNRVILCIESLEIYDKDFMPYAIKLEKLEYSDIMSWLTDRAIPLNRKNAEKIYMKTGLSRDHEEYKLMYLTHALSINDNYWIANENEVGKLRYEDISIFRNSLNKSLYMIALKGEGNFTITDKNISAEYTGQGTFPKCFVREKDGIYLYKHSHEKGIINEITSANIAKVMGLPTVEYTRANLFGVDCTKSKIVTNEDVNWETAFNLAQYMGQFECAIPQAFALDSFGPAYINMIIFDGLVLNNDRHMKNWAFEFNANTNTLIGLAPSYDYNNCFAKGIPAMSNLIFDGNKRMSILKAARVAYRDYGTTLNFNNLSNYISSVQLPVDVKQLINRINYIKGVKSNMNDCFTSVLN